MTAVRMTALAFATSLGLGLSACTEDKTEEPDPAVLHPPPLEGEQEEEAGEDDDLPPMREARQTDEYDVPRGPAEEE